MIESACKGCGAENNAAELPDAGARMAAIDHGIADTLVAAQTR
jgi:hypothetical protein